METKRPFFSIVIPTKNRPDYLKESIKSVVQQNFSDYELIISDNFNDTSTQEVIHLFEHHSNVHSYRTSEKLNMIDHWEFATKKASGKYVILLPDRKLFFQGALKKIHDALQKEPSINVFSFGVKVFNDLEKKMGWDIPIFKTTIHQSSSLITNFLDANYYSLDSLDTQFPKTLNGGFKNEFAQKARSITGHYFNNKGVTTPDYSSLFINLALNEKTLYIGEKILLLQGEHTSNGRHFGVGKVKAYMDSLQLDEPYKRVRIKAPIIYNLLLADFLVIREKFNGNLSNASLNFNNYFYTNYWDLLVKKKMGMSKESLSYFMNEWEHAYQEYIRENALPFSKKQTQVDFEAYDAYARKKHPSSFKRHVQDFLDYRFPNNVITRKIIRSNYPNALAAAGFKLRK